jgi:hypothetical protein
MAISERAGVIAALLSSALGGTAAALTRYAIGATDPVTLAAFRFGIAFLLVVPIALALRSKWPVGRDWLGVAGLGRRAGWRTARRQPARRHWRGGIRNLDRVDRRPKNLIKLQPNEREGRCRLSRAA